jgi:hypothetical protein
VTDRYKLVHFYYSDCGLLGAVRFAKDPHDFAASMANPNMPLRKKNSRGIENVAHGTQSNGAGPAESLPLPDQRKSQPAAK